MVYVSTHFSNKLHVTPSGRPAPPYSSPGERKNLDRGGCHHLTCRNASVSRRNMEWHPVAQEARRCARQEAPEPPKRRGNRRHAWFMEDGLFLSTPRQVVPCVHKRRCWPRRLSALRGRLSASAKPLNASPCSREGRERGRIGLGTAYGTGDGELIGAGAGAPVVVFEKLPAVGAR